MFELELKQQMEIGSRPRAQSSLSIWDSDMFQDCGDCDICRRMLENPDADYQHHDHSAFPQEEQSSDSDDSDEFFLAVEDDLGREMRLAREMAGPRSVPPPPATKPTVSFAPLPAQSSRVSKTAPETRF